MKTYLECIPCFFKQALFAARIVLRDEMDIKHVLDRIGAILSHIPLESSPPQTGREIYRIIREMTGIDDPFRELKAQSTDAALGLYPALKGVVESANDPLKTAVRVAIAGNVIDFGANPEFELEKDVRAILETQPAIDDYSLFAKKLGKAKTVLYLGDNAAETVFDKILIETMHKPVVYAVRGRAVINDATLEDARNSGLHKVATVISSGCDAPGFILSTCSGEFVDYFTIADLIISKGQGNWEALSNADRPIFFLLKAKCQVVATELGVATGDTVIKYASGRG
jgi:uncharacterized protein with ATP-grasp and redox domains